MNEINREQFEAWLFSQPKERMFNFLDIHQCALCSYFKEMTAYSNATVGGEFFYPHGSSNEGVPLPSWIMGGTGGVLRTGHLPTSSIGGMLAIFLSVADIQKRYRELFPDSAPEVPALCPKAVEVPA